MDFNKTIYINNDFIIIKKDKLINYLILFIILLLLSNLIFLKYFLIHGEYVNITIFVLLGNFTNYLFYNLNKKN